MSIAQAGEMGLRTMDRLRDESTKIGRHVQGPFVKHLVVKSTERNSVCHLVGASVVVPLNVSSFQSKGLVIQL